MRNKTQTVKRKWQVLAALGVLGVLPLAGCNTQPEQSAPDVAPPMPTENVAPGTADSNAAMDDAATGVTVPQSPTEAVANLQPTKGSKVSGMVTFMRQPDGNGVKIKADINGLSPGKHGFHIHEKGDCSAPGREIGGRPFQPDQNGARRADGDAASRGRFRQRHRR